VAVVFFDTSALVRRYISSEPGANRVRNLCRRTSGHILMLSRLTAVELASAINRRLREGAITAARRDQLWRLFATHLRRQYRVVVPDEGTYRAAERLLRSYPLRAYDAMQVAGALHLADLFTGVAPDFRFCTADRGQADAARGEGLAVEFIA
jgi:predicted nucleic acid-binding protein